MFVQKWHNRLYQHDWLDSSSSEHAQKSTTLDNVVDDAEEERAEPSTSGANEEQSEKNNIKVTEDIDADTTKKNEEVVESTVVSDSGR